ncbi:hypothetical protein BDU57DRAFT_539979 [Ampelomyces quisqualis]|uniref:Uncharacterized protein n=1 Tax=Ampelomyces quisqualis TaxID=50730 RepID=A0A6A5QJ49_AMPQU|nr:hypothetical protein BDU57DRAFT_539979 [Ampelomyces quisqualis]
MAHGHYHPYRNPLHYLVPTRHAPNLQLQNDGQMPQLPHAPHSLASTVPQGLQAPGSIYRTTEFPGRTLEDGTSSPRPGDAGPVPESIGAPGPSMRGGTGTPGRKKDKGKARATEVSEEGFQAPLERQHSAALRGSGSPFQQSYGFQASHGFQSSQGFQQGYGYDRAPEFQPPHRRKDDDFDFSEFLNEDLMEDAETADLGSGEGSQQLYTALDSRSARSGFTEWADHLATNGPDLPPAPTLHLQESRSQARTQAQPPSAFSPRAGLESQPTWPNPRYPNAYAHSMMVDNSEYERRAAEGSSMMSQQASPRDAFETQSIMGIKRKTGEADKAPPWIGLEQQGNPFRNGFEHRPTPARGFFSTQSNTRPRARNVSPIQSTPLPRTGNPPQQHAPQHVEISATLRAQQDAELAESDPTESASSSEDDDDEVEYEHDADDEAEHEHDQDEQPFDPPLTSAQRIALKAHQQEMAALDAEILHEDEQENAYWAKRKRENDDLSARYRAWKEVKERAERARREGIEARARAAVAWRDGVGRGEGGVSERCRRWLEGWEDV